MHILVVNDDGPPSRDGSPFVHSLVNELKAQGHFVTVVLPNRQRSWIGKAHFVGEIVRPTYYYPDRLFQSNDPPPLDHSSNEGNHHEHPWVLVNSTPAGCVQIGLHHSHALHKRDQGEERPNPVDLVISGPNLGANTTTLFSLSSGTIGGALEAALCGKRSIALSFEPPSKLPSYDSDMITEASRHSVRLINYLYHNWDEGVELYSINVPLQPATTAAGKRKVMYSRIRPNRWLSESPSGRFHPGMRLLRWMTMTRSNLLRCCDGSRIWLIFMEARTAHRIWMMTGWCVVGKPGTWPVGPCREDLEVQMD